MEFAKHEHIDLMEEKKEEEYTQILLLVPLGVST